MMKSFFGVLLLIASSIVTAMAQTHGPSIIWDKSVHDFGDVVQGEKVEHVFKFKNTGDEPLIITNVQVTCGCTTPRGWARDPILPGHSSEIVIAFNSLGKYGRQNKVITILSNAANPDNAQISFTANVVEKK